MIKYMDEMVDLDDICHFRAEIDSYPNYNEDNFYFTIDLMFADITASTSEGSKLDVRFHSSFLPSLLHS